MQALECNSVPLPKMANLFQLENLIGFVLIGMSRFELDFIDTELCF